MNFMTRQAQELDALSSGEPAITWTLRSRCLAPLRAVFGKLRELCSKGVSRTDGCNFRRRETTERLKRLEVLYEGDGCCNG